MVDRRINYKFNVNLAVRNKAFEKSVGIRWTWNNWKTYNDSTAAFVRKIDDQFELWSVNVDAGTSWSASGSQPDEISFTAFASFAKGETQWDPLANYWIYKKATQNEPLAYLASAVKYQPSDKKAYLSGIIRAYPFTTTADTQPGKLKVRWSVDGWKTTQDTVAQTYKQGDKTWSWTFLVALDPVNLPADVSFAVLYESSKGVFWWNNGGANKVHKLKPTVTFRNTVDLSNPVDGVINLSADFSSDLLLAPPGQGRVDTAPFTSLTTVGTIVDTSKLTNGPHTFSARIALEDGTIAATYTQPFTIEHGRVAWASYRSPTDGKVYISYEESVARYTTYGTIHPPEVVISIFHAEFVTADTEGNIYITTSNGISKYDPHGTPVTLFGKNGTLNLRDGTFGDDTFCWIGQPVVYGAFIVVPDTCHARLVRLDATTGAYQSSVSIDGTRNPTVVYLTLDPDTTTPAVWATAQTAEYQRLVKVDINSMAVTGDEVV
ncbi:hypothetical protein HK104_004195, partial [Borealophlyctis nickersoniae]